MQIAPIRSPLDMLRVQARLTSLRSGASTQEERAEIAALQDVVEHYRCITESRSTGVARSLSRPVLAGG